MWNANGVGFGDPKLIQARVPLATHAGALPERAPQLPPEKSWVSALYAVPSVCGPGGVALAVKSPSFTTRAVLAVPKPTYRVSSKIAGSTFTSHDNSNSVFAELTRARNKSCTPAPSPRECVSAPTQRGSSGEPSKGAGVPLNQSGGVALPGTPIAVGKQLVAIFAFLCEQAAEIQPPSVGLCPVECQLRTCFFIAPLALQNELDRGRRGGAGKWRDLVRRRFLTGSRNCVSGWRSKESGSKLDAPVRRGRQNRI